MIASMRPLAVLPGIRWYVVAGLVLQVAAKATFTLANAVRVS